MTRTIYEVDQFHAMSFLDGGDEKHSVKSVELDRNPPIGYVWIIEGSAGRSIWKANYDSSG